MRMPGRGRLALVAGAVVLALVAVLIATGPRGGGTPVAQPQPSESPRPLTAAEIYALVAPSLVIVEGHGGDSSESVGTGFVASADGAILTALHVVDDATAIEVVFADGTRSAATLLTAEPEQDIAILGAALAPELLVPVTLGGAGQIGDDVIAIGHQLGLTGSATAGIISGLDRATTTVGGTGLSGLIQFDAAVNPGSSGGPLVNARGETIGVVVGLINPTGPSFAGVGFAVPIGTAVAAGGGGPQR